MTHNIAHVDRFDESTKIIYRLLYLANTPQGFFVFLPKVIRSLEKDRTCKSSYNKVKTRLIDEDSELQNLKQEVVDWMLMKLKQFRGLKCAKFAEVKKTIECAELILSGQAYEISSGGYLSVLTWYFEQACQSVVFYGYAPEFGDWMKVSTRDYVHIFPKPLLENPTFGKVITPLTPEGKAICKRLEHGFVKAVVESGAGFFDEDGPPRYIIEWGDIVSITYPKSLLVWRQSQDLIQSKVNYDQKAEHNLRYLLQLCYFENLKPIPISELPKPKSVLEADSLCNQQLLQYYLSGFKTDDWDKAPSSREDILSKLDRLLAFLQIEDDTQPLSKRGPRTVKEDARKFVQETLDITWDAIEKEGKKPRNYQELRMVVFKTYKSTPEYIREAISDKLLDQEISKFAKRKSWKPTRGKDQGKRHTI